MSPANCCLANALSKYLVSYDFYYVCVYPSFIEFFFLKLFLLCVFPSVLSGVTPTMLLRDLLHSNETTVYCIDIRKGKFTTGMLFSSRTRCKGVQDDVCTYTRCGNLMYPNCYRAPEWLDNILVQWAKEFLMVHNKCLVLWRVSAVPGWQRLIRVRTFGIFCITQHYGTLRLPHSYLMP